ncbi:MAG: serine/threonine protein kinase, partial [Deltaproteobacteria bacterium]|nr:serine/threonine protein kinase [Kofleriaceae bacterium]
MRPGELVAGRFEVEIHVGSGGMGSVHRARDRESGALVALKRLRVADADASRRFLREAELLARLRHPGIVSYVAHGLDDAGEPYLAMAWIDGEDLAHRLARGPLDEREAQALARSCLGALEHAHGLGMVHRDLKPGNVRIPGGDVARATLVDFGVARLLDHTALTRPGGVVGTPGYMAPEQARGEDVVDARADLFALGCVLFECVVGRPAFLARDGLALLFRLLVDDPGAPHHLRPEISPRFSALVTRLMQKDAARRPPSAAAALGLLDDATVAEPTDEAA